MILVTGGAYQGKGSFAKELQKTSGENTTVVEHIHLVIAQAIRENQDPYEVIEALVKEHPEGIFTVNELGCGIVPMERFDREWRETTGRICCKLAKEAKAVYRVTCGIGTRIK